MYISLKKLGGIVVEKNIDTNQATVPKYISLYFQ